MCDTRLEASHDRGGATRTKPSEGRAVLSNLLEDPGDVGCPPIALRAT